MELINLKDSSDRVNFSEAVQKGLGKHQGLYFPEHIAALPNINELLTLPLAERSAIILKHLIGDELPSETIEDFVNKAFTFPAPLAKVDKNIHCLELFHGPTLAFKDFGGRFMAQCLAHFSEGKPVTILTATSGDTGAAVAHAFYGIENIQVVILYPKGKISALQQKLFTTLGGNIHTVAVDADFDACQQLVKQSFDDAQLRQDLHLNSANSINISRLLAQVCYYFEAVAQLPEDERSNSVFAVPSGNFGNLTAGIIAKRLGLPIKRFIAATNSNDTVPRYLANGQWQPNATVATMSNAMDVSKPNNWPRIQAMLDAGDISPTDIVGEAVDEEYTQVAMRKLSALGYTSEPHAAVAYQCLSRQLQNDEVGVFLGTAHPAKFRETVENVLGEAISLPPALAKSATMQEFSHSLENSYTALKQLMFSILK